MKSLKHVFTLAVLFSILMSAGLSACSQASPAEAVTLRIAVIPVLDTLPMYVAQSEGLFQKHGVQVQFIPVQSAPERDQLIAAGQADGMINELLSAMFFNRDGVKVQVVRYGAVATADQHLFSILAAGNSGITSPQQLAGVEIGVSKGTVIEYLTARLLQAEGLTDDQIKLIAVPSISSRMELLASGELKAGVLPEPLTSLARQQGAVVVLDDTKHPEYSFSVYTFSKSMIDAHPDAIKGFLAAVEEAVALINSNGEKYTGLLTEQKLVPAPLVGSFPVRKYSTAGVPTEQQWQDALSWAKEQGLLTEDLNYADTVTGKYLP